MHYNCLLTALCYTYYHHIYIYLLYTWNAISKEIKSNCFSPSLSLFLSYTIIIISYIRWSLTVHFNIIQIGTYNYRLYTAYVACNNSPPTTDFVCSTADILNKSLQTHNFVKHSSVQLLLCNITTTAVTYQIKFKI